jgi:hypothetical protein
MIETWSFRCKEDREKAEDKDLDEKPLSLIRFLHYLLGPYVECEI